MSAALATASKVLPSAPWLLSALRGEKLYLSSAGAELVVD
jgi:hypothetical protein